MTSAQHAALVATSAGRVSWRLSDSPRRRATWHVDGSGYAAARGPFDALLAAGLIEIGDALSLVARTHPVTTTPTGEEKLA